MHFRLGEDMRRSVPGSASAAATLRELGLAVALATTIAWLAATVPAGIVRATCFGGDRQAEDRAGVQRELAQTAGRPW